MGKKNDLIVGMIVGLAGGVFGNIWVTSIYRIIDKTPGGYNWLTCICGLMLFFLIMLLLFRALKK